MLEESDACLNGIRAGLSRQSDLSLPGEHSPRALLPVTESNRVLYLVSVNEQDSNLHDGVACEVSVPCVTETELMDCSRRPKRKSPARMVVRAGLLVKR